jgi:hypothetical protein
VSTVSTEINAISILYHYFTVPVATLQYSIVDLTGSVIAIRHFVLLVSQIIVSVSDGVADVVVSSM